MTDIGRDLPPQLKELWERLEFDCRGGFDVGDDLGGILLTNLRSDLVGRIMELSHLAPPIRVVIRGGKGADDLEQHSRDIKTDAFELTPGAGGQFRVHALRLDTLNAKRPDPAALYVWDANGQHLKTTPGLLPGLPGLGQLSRLSAEEAGDRNSLWSIYELESREQALAGMDEYTKHSRLFPPPEYSTPALNALTSMFGPLFLQLPPPIRILAEPEEPREGERRPNYKTAAFELALSEDGTMRVRVLLWGKVTAETLPAAHVEFWDAAGNWWSGKQ